MRSKSNPKSAATHLARAIHTFAAIALVFAFVDACVPAVAQTAPMGATRHLGFETEQEILSDFASESAKYEVMGREGLDVRKLAIEPGKFGNALHIKDGWPISKGTWNESGLDCDLIVAVVWGEWHTKPHYWGAGAFHGEQGAVAFWVKADKLHPGIVFMQGSIAWGRKERDLFTVEVDKDGRFSAHIRDLRNQYHRVAADKPTWIPGAWQHIVVSYDNAFGLKLYQNGELIGSNWGRDAWWGTTNPGLFSPFLPESYYDEICFFDAPLDDAQVKSLFESNSIASAPVSPPLDEQARKRLLDAHGDVSKQDIPAVAAGNPLHLKQTRVKDARDEMIPAWWVFDGRYELAWPHPYLMFTFIFGDVDFHGERIDIALEELEHPNYISFEGMLDELKLEAGSADNLDQADEVFSLGNRQPFFRSRRLELDGASGLRVPLVKQYGSPAELEGSAYVPLSGPTRIHEIQLWEASSVLTPTTANAETWLLGGSGAIPRLTRYDAAVKKLIPLRNRQVLPAIDRMPAPSRLRTGPMQSVQILGPDLSSDSAIDKVTLKLLMVPQASADHLRIRLRDPANPSRVWAQTWVRVEYPVKDEPQPVEITLDVIDLMMASEDRLWLELTSVAGTEIITGDGNYPSAIIAHRSSDRERALEAYAKHEMLPARMQYTKEYNYRPWRWTGEPISLQEWSNFGGPYDMAYPPLAVLRHDPHNTIANTYRTLVLERTWHASIDVDDVPRPMQIDTPANAPAWAVWERELYKVNKKATDWIVTRQRQDGMFWGGSNDDCFIPLGYAGMPLLGEESTRQSWLRYYEGLEEMGVFYDGYCDIWPIDPLHITDFIGSRGLMLSYALGDPYVVERELRTAQRYSERIAEVDKKRAEKGLPPLTGDAADRNKNEAGLIEQVDAEIRNYSLAHLGGFWNTAEKPEPHVIDDRAAIARQMMIETMKADDIALFGVTEAMVHTDNQRGFGRDALIQAALGGRVQGRVEPYPIGIAASWEQVETPDLARLVTYADAKRLVVNLYNFRTEPIDAVLRVWRLEPGMYSVSVGPDVDDNGVIDFDAPAHAIGKQAELKRYSTLPISVPSRANIAVVIEKVQETGVSEPLPDLAIGPRDITVKRGVVHVTVHNIGAAPSPPSEIVLLDANRAIIARSTVDAMDSPRAHLTAQRRTIVLNAGREAVDAQCIISLDPDDRILELLEENNEMPVGQ